MRYNYYNQSSTVAFLENEAYYSSGAYLHVVGLLQGSQNKDRDKDIYINTILKLKNIKFFAIMSFYDNLGFLLDINSNYTDNPEFNFIHNTDKVNHDEIDLLQEILINIKIIDDTCNIYDNDKYNKLLNKIKKLSIITNKNPKLS